MMIAEEGKKKKRKKEVFTDVFRRAVNQTIKKIKKIKK